MTMKGTEDGTTEGCRVVVPESRGDRLLSKLEKRSGHLLALKGTACLTRREDLPQNLQAQYVCKLAFYTYVPSQPSWSLPNDVNEFKIIFLEDLKTNVQETMNSVYEFLDLPPYKLADDSAKNTREYTENELPNHLKEKLYRFFEPFDHKLREIGDKYGIENLQRRGPESLATRCS